MSSTPVRFPILFTGANKAMAGLGIVPSRCFVEVDDTSMRVQMSWTFAATVPRSSVRSAAPDDGAVGGWGVHGWKGRWLVNGSSSGLVRVEIDPPAVARVLAWPVRLRVLRVSVEDPTGLVAALSPSDANGPSR